MFLFVRRFAFFLTFWSILINSNLYAASTIDERSCVIVNVHELSGFFAVFCSVIGVLDDYDKGKYAGVKIDFNSGLYLDPDKGPNWWEYFFEPIANSKEAKNAPQHVLTGSERLGYSGVGFHLPRDRAFYLLQKYVRLKKKVRKEVDSFYEKHFYGKYVIGIHHRGTDKFLESPLISYAHTLHVLNDVMSLLSPEDLSRLKIYVATDEQEFLTHIKSLYPSLVIHSDFVRSNDNTSLHGFSNHYESNYQKGKEALLDCLLLSKCKVLIYPSTSSLSIAATKFNPVMQALPLR